MSGTDSCRLSDAEAENTAGGVVIYRFDQVKNGKRP